MFGRSFFHRLSLRADQGVSLPREKAYSRTKLRISLMDMGLSLALLGGLAFSGLSLVLAGRISAYIANDYLRFLAFFFAAGTGFALVSLPLDFYSGYVLEHRFALSNQTVFRWILEKLKSTAVGTALGVPVSLIFFYLLRSTGELWWLYFGLVMIFFTVILARVAPSLIFPLFYKYRALEDGPLKTAILDMLREQGIAIGGIYSFNMSRDTKKANAGFAGIGKGKRIILSDTLLDRFTIQEILVVFAHEMGHYKKRDIWKGLCINSAVILLSLFLCGRIYAVSLAPFGHAQAADIAALPMLIFYLSIFSLAVMPAVNAVARAYERGADRFALELTRDRDSFISLMNKLAELNLSDRDPHPFTEFFLYDHPAIKKRIDFAEKMTLPLS